MSLVRLSRSFARLTHLRSVHRFCSTSSTGDAKTGIGGPKESKETAEQPEQRADELTLLYDSVLKQVPNHGWTDTAISEAVKELGWSLAATRMIARGPVEVVEEFINRSNKQLAEQLAEDMREHEEDESSPQVERAAFAIRKRISMIEPYHDSWTKALALQALPQNAPRALKASAMMVDEIAHYSGYRQPNFSWYSDRAVLGLAYHSAELYWLTDRSKGREDTWRFLERRLNDSNAMRSKVADTYFNVMTLSDATLASLSSLIRATRRSY